MLFSRYVDAISANLGSFFASWSTVYDVVIVYDVLILLTNAFYIVICNSYGTYVRWRFV